MEIVRESSDDAASARGAYATLIVILGDPLGEHYDLRQVRDQVSRTDTPIQFERTGYMLA